MLKRINGIDCGVTIIVYVSGLQLSTFNEVLYSGSKLTYLYCTWMFTLYVALYFYCTTSHTMED